jgi:phosphoenolpyruvate-protein phosphotransferase
MVRVHKGETVALGVALGTVHLRGYGAEADFPLRIAADEVEVELNALRASLDQSREQIEALKAKHGENLGESELRIFDVHLGYLADPMFVDEIEKLVVEERFSVRAAIQKIATDYERIFELVENEYLRQRAGDFRDIATRVLGNLPPSAGARAIQPTSPEGRYVLAARRLTVNDLFRLDHERVQGIVTEEGGVHGHAAILARSMGIPAITGIRDLSTKVTEGAFVILDAGAAELHVEPDAQLREEYGRAAEQFKEAADEANHADIAHETRDGTAVRLGGACGNLSEVGLAVARGMDGIGLYRTELMFLVESRLPTEDLLVHHYAEVVAASSGQSVCFRLLDLPSSAQVPTLPRPLERNAALGLRGVRALLDDTRVLRLQVRAILRAAASVENAAILVPFVTSVNDLQRVNSAIVEERHELRKRGVPCADQIHVAPIVEVPAAAFTCRALLVDADFVVVALDDLQALLLAADRDAAAVREYYEMAHPAMFELLQRIAVEAAAAEKPVVLFGEAAADPLRLPFYLGIGIRDFAVAPARIGGMLDVLQRYTIDECEKFAEQLLEAPRGLDVQRILLRTGAAH